MNRPVTSILFSELARSVEWVDDPHARRVQPFRATRRLFGEDSIVGVSFGEGLDDQLMRSAIARGAECVGVRARAVGETRPEAKEECAGVVGDAPRRQMVGLRPHEADGTSRRPWGP